MKRIFTAAFLMLTLAVPAFAQNPGVYTSASRGGNVQIGRASVSRQLPNSGNPKVFNVESWNPSPPNALSAGALGIQWTMQCGVEASATAPDLSQYNPSTGTGLVTYHQTFTGGTFTLYPDPSVGWVNAVPVTCTLGTTSVVTQVNVINFIPVSSSFTGSTTGTFASGCTMDFAMGNGFGLGETSDPPGMTKPLGYPAFLAADCNPADEFHQFGTWGEVNDIFVHINGNCTTPTKSSTWGALKSIYR